MHRLKDTFLSIIYAIGFPGTLFPGALATKPGFSHPCPVVKFLWLNLPWNKVVKIETEREKNHGIPRSPLFGRYESVYPGFLAREGFGQSFKCLCSCCWVVVLWQCFTWGRARRRKRERGGIKEISPYILSSAVGPFPSPLTIKRGLFLDFFFLYIHWTLLGF